jgi:hypothetical protein
MIIINQDGPSPKLSMHLAIKVCTYSYNSVNVINNIFYFSKYLPISNNHRPPTPSDFDKNLSYPFAPSAFPADVFKALPSKGQLGRPEVLKAELLSSS